MYTRPRSWYLFTLLFILLGLTLSGWVWVFRSHLHSSSAPAMQSTSHSKHLRALKRGEPPLAGEQLPPGTRLLIPRLGVNAPIEPVGLNGDGSLATPTLHPWRGVGWYQDSPAPGKPGKALLVGLQRGSDGTAAVFALVRTIRLGDSVMVVDTSGHMLYFAVTYVASYPPQQIRSILALHTTHKTALDLVVYANPYQPAQRLALVISTILWPLDVQQNQSQSSASGQVTPGPAHSKDECIPATTRHAVPDLTPIRCPTAPGPDDASQ